MASSNVDVLAQVVKIEPGGKYVLLFPSVITHDVAARLRHDLEEFMTGGQTFAVIAGAGIQLVRVDEADDASGVPSE